jgi:hypothetical protein
MGREPPRFDPVKYKETTKQQWQAAAEAWHRWGPTLAAWLGPATEIMLDMAASVRAAASLTWRQARASKRWSERVAWVHLVMC